MSGDTYTQVYKGSGRAFTDTIPRGETSVRYRVAGCDAYDAQSDWQTGPIRAIINNQPPVIATEQSADIGLITDSLAFLYTVSDPDADTETLTVTEYIDGTERRTLTLENGDSATFTITEHDLLTILNGTHTVRIVASDGESTGAWEGTFLREQNAARVWMTDGLAAPDGEPITAVSLAVVGSIPADADFTAEVTNSWDPANPDAAVWEDATSAVKNGFNYVFTGTGNRFNFRVSVEAGPSGLGGYIASINGGFE